MTSHNLSRLEEYLVTQFEREYLLAPNKEKEGFWKTYSWEFPWHHLADSQTGASLLGNCISEKLKEVLSEVYEMVVMKAYSDDADTYWCDGVSEGMLHILQTYYEIFLDTIYEGKEGKCLQDESYESPKTATNNPSPFHKQTDLGELGTLRALMGYRIVIKGG